MYPLPGKNLSNKPVVISVADKSCGCTVPTIRDEIVDAGEWGTIEVSIDTTGKPLGALNEYLTVKTTDPETNSFKTDSLYVEADLMRSLYFSPSSFQVVSYHGKLIDSATTIQLFAESTAADKWLIKNMKWMGEKLGDIEIHPVSAEFTADPALLVGSYQSTISFQLMKTDTQELRSIQVPVTVNQLSDLQVSPVTLSFDFITPKGSKTKSILIKDQKNRKIRYLDSPQDIPIQISPAEDKDGLRLDITLNGSNMPEFVNKRLNLRIAMEDQTEEQIGLPISAARALR